MHSPVEDAEKLFDEYSNPVYRFCLARLGSPEEAEDALQVTYLNAWRSLNAGTRPAEPKPWLFQIAANVCSTVLRKRLRAAPVESRAPEDLEQVGAEDRPRDELLGLDKALEALPDRQRRAILLRDWRGLSYAEIATALDASAPAVETLLFRARRAVAASLAAPAQRVRRTPVRSVLSALLPWPSLFSTVKSSVAHVTTTKVAVGVAVGATAPLVAFGVLEETLRSGGASAEAAPPARTQPAVPGPTAGPQMAAGEQRRPLGQAVAGARARGSKTGPKQSGNHAPNSAPGGSPGQPQPSVPVVTPAVPLPPPATESPGEEPVAAAKVLICHVTGSKKNPFVTISVSLAAVETHLQHGDTLGSCPS
ncbi:MAG: sigma-70 family RNA polymerase sigma factor [Gaiellaceae bacterium]